MDPGFLMVCAAALIIGGVLFVQGRIDEHRWKDDIERDRIKRERMEQALLQGARPPAE